MPNFDIGHYLNIIESFSILIRYKLDDCDLPYLFSSSIVKNLIIFSVTLSKYIACLLESVIQLVQIISL